MSQQPFNICITIIRFIVAPQCRRNAAANKETESKQIKEACTGNYYYLYAVSSDVDTCDSMEIIIIKTLNEHGHWSEYRHCLHVLRIYLYETTYVD